jgi:hypothetical protein
MDLSIRLITPELMEELGADAFDRGVGVNDHGMSECATARKSWQYGWHKRRVVRSRQSGDHFTDVTNMVDQQLAEVCPP